MMPAYARRTDPETSHAAAVMLSEESLSKAQAAVLSVLRTHGPLADFELDATYERLRLGPNGWFPMISPSGLRTRRKELVHYTFVVAAGETKTPGGRRALMWRALSGEERSLAIDPTLF
jgi:hypothetical protein